MKTISTAAAVVLSLALVHCAKKEFSARPSTTDQVLNANGSSPGAGSGTSFFDNANGANGTNGTGANGTAGNGTATGLEPGVPGLGTGSTPVGTSTGIVGSNQGVTQIVYATTTNGQPTGAPVIVQPDFLQVNCGEWISKQDIYRVHMANMLEATAPLPPRREDYPRENSGISIEDATLNRVCAELGCGPALEVNFRKYTSPDNNSVVYWQVDRWLKVIATDKNRKIDNKNGSAGLLCSPPGSMTTGFIKKNSTD